MRHLVSISDLGAKDIDRIFSLAERLRGRAGFSLKGKSWAMLFSKPSTRTRVSFEVAINDLAGHPIYMDMSSTQLSRGESIQDTARVLSRYVDGIIARLHSHQHMLWLARYSSVPVINALDDLLHPCQALSDFYTIRKTLGSVRKRVVFLGDGSSNVCHSLMQASSRLGSEMLVACPEGYSPHHGIQKETGIRAVRDPKEAAEGADVLYTDAWVSMGQKRNPSRIKSLRPYQLNREILSHASKKCVVMHCLPAHRGEEITDDVMDGPHSVVWEQAENRLHVQKGILAWLAENHKAL
jgi:ornithine carbamoyltransferase